MESKKILTFLKYSLNFLIEIFHWLPENFIEFYDKHFTAFLLQLRLIFF